MERHNGGMNGECASLAAMRAADRHVVELVMDRANAMYTEQATGAISEKKKKQNPRWCPISR